MPKRVRVWSGWDAGWWAEGIGSGAKVRDAAAALRLALGRELSSEERDLAAVLGRVYQSEIDVEVTADLAILAGDPPSAPAWTWRIGGTRSEPVPLRVLLDWLPSAVARTYPRSD